jgi:hypothetical protein
MSKITFVVPLGQGTQWENNELRYMIRSLETHCQFDFDVMLFTTNKMDWLDCKQVLVERTYPKAVREYFNGKDHYENYYDVIHKLQAAIDHEDVSEDFVFIYDDLILLEDYYLADVKKIYAANKYENNKQFFDGRKNKWIRTIHTSIQLCMAHGYETYIYETHLPRFFNKANVKQMFQKHIPEQLYIPYALSTLYYNMYYKKPTENYYAYNTVKAGMYGRTHHNDEFRSTTEQDIQLGVLGKLWLNYNNRGLTPALKRWIELHFPVKSRFEK